MESRQEKIERRRDTCILCNNSIKEDAKAKGLSWELGCNAEPLASGQCCDTCDKTKVLPERLRLAGF